LLLTRLFSEIHSVSPFVLTSAELYHNAYIHTSIGLLTDLRDLEISVDYSFDPNLWKPIPSEIGRLTSLTRLVLGHTKFRGLIPSELARLTALKECQIPYLYGGAVAQFCCKNKIVCGCLVSSLKLR
jgi:hypothetical protein